MSIFKQVTPVFHFNVIGIAEPPFGLSPALGGQLCPIHPTVDLSRKSVLAAPVRDQGRRPLLVLDQLNHPPIMALTLLEGHHGLPERLPSSRLALRACWILTVR
jgi:hypothetical protein